MQTRTRLLLLCLGLVFAPVFAFAESPAAEIGNAVCEASLPVPGFPAAGNTPTAGDPKFATGIETALNDARRLASLHPGLVVVRVEGGSMRPFFDDGDVLVCRPLPVSQLKPGMLVLYTDRFKATVAHRVIASDPTGCTVQGYANLAADSTRVTAVNLQGVVYAIFHSAVCPGAPPVPAATSVVTDPTSDALRAALASTPIAFASPAR